jgi:hypothetical protein
VWFTELRLQLLLLAAAAVAADGICWFWPLPRHPMLCCREPTLRRSNWSASSAINTTQ